MKVTKKLSNLFFIITLIGMIMTGLFFMGSIIFDLEPVFVERAVIARNANIMVIIVSGILGLICELREHRNRSQINIKSAHPSHPGSNI